MKTRKRILSVFLSAVLAVTMLPTFTLTASAKTDWTLIASTDFRDAKWTKQSSSGSYNYAQGSGFTSVAGSGCLDYMTWDAANYGENTYATAIGYSGDDSWQVQADSRGALLSDSSIYLTGYYKNGEAQANTPITGLTSFKIEFEFCYLANRDRNNDDVFFKISNYNSNNSVSLTSDFGTKKNMGDDAGGNHVWFTQALNGTMRSKSDSGYVDRSVSSNKRLDHKSDSTNFTTGTYYRYVMTYAHDIVTSYVTDLNGNVIVNLGSVKDTSLKNDTSNIATFQLGSKTGNYLKHTAVKYAWVYKGTETDTANSVDEDDDKYLFSYFTGNSTEDLHLAVSDDGYNFEGLNGNKAIWDSSDLPASPDVYPKTDWNGADVTSVNGDFSITGHVRDPFIFKAENDNSYYVLATDLQCSRGWSNNNCMMVWHVDDPSRIDETDPWFIDVQRLAENIGGRVNRAWAPEAIWDPFVGKYMLHFGIQTTTLGTTALYYTYTSDFKSFTEPKRLLQVSYKNIDSNINYDGSKYVLTFKNENDDVKRIYRCTSERPNGPYGTPVQLATSYAAEGCEVYPIGTGTSLTYAMILDDYDNNAGATFRGFTASTIDGLSTDVESSLFKINHLSPRHGSVIRITTAQYNSLVEKYGKQTYDADVKVVGYEVNDALIARYFTDSDLTYNAATGEENELTNYGVAYAEVDGKASAYFQGGSINAPTAYGDANGQYLYAEANTIGSGEKSFSSTDIYEGITFDWYSKQSVDSDADGNRIFELCDCTPGTLVWTSAGGDDIASQIHANALRQVGISNKGYTNGSANYFRLGSKEKSQEWHHYTVSVSNGQVYQFVDGVIYNSTPKRTSNLSESWLSALKSGGHLMFGLSSYRDDVGFDGYIHDFRIYKGTYTPREIELSINDLANKESTFNASDFYDPMENITVDGVEYKNYNNSTDSLSDAHGTVLSLSGANQQATLNNGNAHNYQGAASNTGYTVAFWYNAANNSDSHYNHNIFNIGNKTGTQYFILEEGGTLYFRDDTGSGNSFADITNAFGTDSAFANGDGNRAVREKYKNQWHHYIIRIVPNGSYDTLYFFIDGSLVNTVESSDYDVISGLSIHEYFASTRPVYYGETNQYWGAADRGYLDDFRIYIGNHCSTAEIYTRDFYGTEALDYAIAAYEAKMAETSTKVFKNMQPAYEAYVYANRVKDAMAYGDNRRAAAAKFKPACDDLVSKTAAMTEWTAATFTATAYHCNADATGAYSNVVYCPQNSTNFSSEFDNNYGLSKIAVPSNIVLAFDGSNKVSMPVILQVRAFDDGDNKNEVDIKVNYVSISKGDFSLNKNWRGTITDYTQWPGMSGSTQLSYSSSVTQAFNKAKNTSYDFFANELVYGGSVNTDSFYTTVSNFDYSISNYHAGFDKGGCNGSVSEATETGSYSVSNNAYVINYKAVTDGVAALKARIAAVSVSNYKQNGLNTLLAAMDEFTADACNPNTYDYSSNVATAVTNCANAIKAAYGYRNATAGTADTSDYANLKSLMDEFKATYDRGFDDLNTEYTLSSAAAFLYAYDDAAAHMQELLTNSYNNSTASTLKNALNVAHNNLDDLANTENLEKAYERANNFLLSLDGKVAQYDAASVQALINAMNALGEDSEMSVYQIVTADARTRLDMGQRTVGVDSELLATAINNAYNGLKITAPDEATQSKMETYGAAVETINNLDPDAYDTTASITSARSYANDAMKNGSASKDYSMGTDSATINVVDTSVSSAVIEEATSRILTALNNSIKRYDISADSGVVSIAGNVGDYDDDGKTATYGTRMTFTAANADTAWYLDVESSSVHKPNAFYGYGETLTVKAIGDLTVTTVCRDNTNNRRIMIYRNYYDSEGKKQTGAPTQFVTFVASGTNYTLPTAPAYAFYTFNGYYVGNTKYNAGDTVTINADTDIIARYDAVDAACAINSTNFAETERNLTVNYNEKVKLEGGTGTYGWVEATDDTGLHFRPFFIGEDVEFYANESVTLKAVNKATFDSFGSTPCINLRKNGVITSGAKVTFNAQVVASDFEAVKECGILVAVANGKQPGGSAYEAITPNATQLIVENSGQQYGYAILRAKSTKFVGANQFSISVASLPAGYIYRGYVIYSDGSSTHTVYSDIM